MGKKLIFALCLVGAVALSGACLAAEHGGMEHGGRSPVTKEHGGSKAGMPSKEQIHDAMKGYVAQMKEATGTFDVNDPETGKKRRLELVRIHERVGKTGDYYYSCADFKDLDTQELLDLDLDVMDKDGRLEVVEVRIHKVGGKERYTYDENDNRIPVKN